MLRYLSIIDLFILGGLLYAWFHPRKILSLSDRKGQRLPEEKIVQWLPRVRPIIIGLFIFLITGRAVMYYFFPQFADLNAGFWNFLHL